MNVPLPTVGDIEDMPVEALPSLAAGLAALQSALAARLMAAVRLSPAIRSADRLLTVQQAATRLGMSPDYLYRHSTTLPFSRRLGRSLRFSEAGIDRWLERYRS